MVLDLAVIANDNPGALTLYMSLGFTVHSETDLYERDYERGNVFVNTKDYDILLDVPAGYQLVEVTTLIPWYRKPCRELFSILLQLSQTRTLF